MKAVPWVRRKSLWESPKTGKSTYLKNGKGKRMGKQQNGSVQFSSVAQSCPTLCDPMNRSTPGLPVHHQLPEFTQTHVHRVSDAIQPSYPLSSPSPPAPNPSQHQSLFQWVNSRMRWAKYWSFSFSIIPSKERLDFSKREAEWQQRKQRKKAGVISCRIF